MVQGPATRTGNRYRLTYKEDRLRAGLEGITLAHVQALYITFPTNLGTEEGARVYFLNIGFWGWVGRTFTMVRTRSQCQDMRQ